MMGRFAMNGVRSSGSGSYIGIDGESLVWQIKLAEMNMFGTQMILNTI